MGQRLRAFRRMASALALLAAAVSSGEAAETDALRERGRALVAGMCAECHAVGRSDSSRHLSAPAFRSLDQRLDLDGLADRLRRGLETGHRDMPAVHLNREDARAVAAYVRSIQSP